MVTASQQEQGEHDLPRGSSSHNSSVTPGQVPWEEAQLPRQDRTGIPKE